MVIRRKGHIIPRNGTVLDEGPHPPPRCPDACLECGSCLHLNNRESEVAFKETHLLLPQGSLVEGPPLLAEGWGFPSCLTQKRLLLDHLAASLPALPRACTGIQLTRVKTLAHSGRRNIGGHFHWGPLGSRYQDRVRRVRGLLLVMPVIVQQERKQD